MILDFGDGFGLRQATADDHPALMDICLKTGDAGADASMRENDPQLLGLIYAVPYQVFEPALAFLVEGPSGPCGYVLGARDTRAFNERLANEWYPDLQARVRDPGDDQSMWQGSDWARHLIHHPDLSVPPGLNPYPSHAHIDLLPIARGRRIAGRAMAFMQRSLSSAGSDGLFVEVDPRNTNARGFYAAVGFERLEDRSLPRRSVFMGMALG